MSGGLYILMLLKTWITNLSFAGHFNGTTLTMMVNTPIFNKVWPKKVQFLAVTANFAHTALKAVFFVTLLHDSSAYVYSSKCKVGYQCKD